MPYTFAKTTIIAVALIAGAGEAAYAKDWIEKVRLTNGIDMTPISVRSDGNKYTKATGSSHRFKLDMYAKAKSGKRIFAVRLGAGNTTKYIESNIGNFDFKYPRAFLGGGTKRTWSHSTNPRVPLGQVVWQGRNPVQACNALLASKLQKGESRASVMSKTHAATVKAKFFMTAVAAKPKFARSGKEPSKKNMLRWTEESSGLNYTVRVRCLPSGNNTNQVGS